MEQCPFCNGNITEKPFYSAEDRSVGYIVVSGKNGKCNDCGAEFIPGDVARRFEDARRARIEAWLFNRIKTAEDLDRLFVSGRELEGMLGKSRQAVAKDMRLRNLVYGFTFKGHRFYLKESVESFVKTGDGRIEIAACTADRTIGAAARYERIDLSKEKTANFKTANLTIA